MESEKSDASAVSVRCPTQGETLMAPETTHALAKAIDLDIQNCCLKSNGLPSPMQMASTQLEVDSLNSYGGNVWK